MRCARAIHMRGEARARTRARGACSRAPRRAGRTSTLVPSGHAAFRRSKAASRSSRRFVFFDAASTSSLVRGCHRPAHRPARHCHAGRTAAQGMVRRVVGKGW